MMIQNEISRHAATTVRANNRSVDMVNRSIPQT